MPIAKKDIKAAVKAVKAATSDGPVKNCTWSNNNAACVHTWYCLSSALLHQTNAELDKVETVKMKQLAFWNGVASPEINEAEARAIADMLTKLLTNAFAAKYEAGQNYASSVVALTAILTQADKTVCELAAVVDETHHFVMEVGS